MDIQTFGNKLLETLDLDPVYVLLREAMKRGELNTHEAAKWCLAYWCYYHAGVATYVTETSGLRNDRYFGLLQTGVHGGGGKPFPRGKERRHFRGPFAIKTLHGLEHAVNHTGKGEAHSIREFVYSLHHPNFQGVRRNVLALYGFGDWMAFKIADMIDVVLEKKIDFSDCSLLMYSEPIKGAKMYLKEIGKPDNWPLQEQLSYTLGHLSGMFGERDAPPDYKRKVELQELETILCKWKSHMNGHYEVGEDIIALKKSLEWKKSEKSETLLAIANEVFK